jgi:hypothetical protein
MCHRSGRFGPASLKPRWWHDIEAAVSEALAEWIVMAASSYLAAGLLFSGPFVMGGVDRIDSAAHGATWGFRVLIVPGVVLFWPLLAIRWARGSIQPPRELTAHRRAAVRRRS